MLKLSQGSIARSLMLLGIMTSLAACSQQPVRELPQVIQCQPPRISPQLLNPPPHKAMDALMDYLQAPSPSATGTEPDKPR